MSIQALCLILQACNEEDGKGAVSESLFHVYRGRISAC